MIIHVITESIQNSMFISDALHCCVNNQIVLIFFSEKISGPSLVICDVSVQYYVSFYQALLWCRYYCSNIYYLCMDILP